MHPIPYARQNISEHDIAAVEEILRAEFITQGPTIENFERVVAQYTGAKYAVAVNSGTSALHIACLAMGLNENDILWTSPNTFVASANCGLYCGAEIDFVDIDPQTYNISVEKLEEKLQFAHKNSKLPKILVAVHFSGQSCDMEKINQLSVIYGFKVLEDASHALGGRYQNHKIGSCAFSDITVLSFHPVKIITTGEGGMALTNNTELYEKLKLFRSHGITRDPSQMQNDSHGPWYYEQLALGYNYRMTDVQAALGISQLQRISEFIKMRHLLAERYNEALKNLPLTLPFQHPDTFSAYHLYVIRLHLTTLKKNRLEIFSQMRENGINVNIHYIPVHIHPYYRNLGFQFGDFPEAEIYYKETISLPMYYGLSFEEQDYVIKMLIDIIS